MTIKTSVCIFMACLKVHAETSTNLPLSDSLIMIVTNHLASTPTNSGIIPVFLSGAMTRFDQDIFRQLVPFSRGDIRDSTASTANETMRNTWIRSLRYSGRDIGENLEVWHRMDDYLGNFLSGLIGSVDEELLDPLDPSFQPAQQSLWKKLREGANLRYGLRPFNSSPYLFLSSEVRKDGTTLLFSNLRYYLDHFQDHRVSLVLGVPIFDDVSLTVGASYTHHMDGDNESPVASIRFEGTINQRSFWYIGYDAGQSQEFRGGLSWNF